MLKNNGDLLANIWDCYTDVLLEVGVPQGKRSIFSSIFGHLLGIFTDLVKDKQTLQFVMNTLIKIREMLDETDGEDRYLSATVLIVRVSADFRSS